MTKFIIDSSDVKEQNFKQASIAIDACFLLAYLDSDDPRGDKVSELLDLWSKEQIMEIVISNNVAAEVVNNLFKNNIRNVLYLMHKKNSRGYKLTSEDYSIIGDYQTANKLTSLVEKKKLDKLVYNGEFYHNIGSIIKEYKVTTTDRAGLHQYYNHAIDTFQDLLRDLSVYLDFRVTTPEINDNDLKDLAFSIMRIQQLDVFDAFHIASSKLHGCNYFATLDNDFIHTYYSEGDVGELKIVKVS